MRYVVHGPCAGTKGRLCVSRESARRVVDRLDSEYGASRHYVTTVTTTVTVEAK